MPEKVKVMALQIGKAAKAVIDLLTMFRHDMSFTITLKHRVVASIWCFGSIG